MSEGFLNLIKTHGLSIVLMLGGLYFLDDKLDGAESRIFALEQRLYDCYEDKFQIRTRTETHADVYRDFKLVATLPKKQKSIEKS